MDRYQQEYGRFLITDDLRLRFSEFQASSEDAGNKAKSAIVETVVIDEAPPFTDNMEVTNA
jgi:hypothetical protein